MATVNQILDIARGEIGYSRWNDPEQGTKYGRWYADLTGDPDFAESGVPYCAMFVSWVFAAAGQSFAGLPGAYCPWIVDAVRAAGASVPAHDARPGDVVLFDWDNDGESDHVGIVEDNDGLGTLTCIEGNTDNGQVLRKYRPYSCVECVGRPAYDSEQVPQTGTSGDSRFGVDIYNGDYPLDISRLSCAFVIMKASEGVGFVDRYAAGFAEQCENCGKLYGFYHFARRNAADAEARFFVDCVRNTGHLDRATLWLDYEADALQNGPEWARLFISTVESLTGKTCGIYTSQSVTREQDFSSIADRPLWVAQYASDNPVYGYQENPWSRPPFGAWGNSCAIHQYTGNGHVDGYVLDCNRVYCSPAEWLAWANSSAPAPTPEPEPVEPMTYMITVDGLRIRTAPTTSYGDTGQRLYAGDVVTVDGYSNADGWVWGRTNSGWIALHTIDYSTVYAVTVSDYDDDPAPTLEPGTWQILVNGLRVRTAPSLNSDVVAHYDAGQTVNLDSFAYGDGWTWGSYVGYSGNRRYIAITNGDSVYMSKF